MEIRTGALEELIGAVRQVPELTPIDLPSVQSRLARSPLILIAEVDREFAGFKAGYDRSQDGSFYSWLGGVAPKFRGSDVGHRLIEAQESWAQANGFHSIRVKTRNRFVAMRILLARCGYDIIDFERPPGAGLADAGLWHEKELSI